MADNVAITAGSGTTVSTEEITTLNGGAVSAQHIQRVAAAIRTADGTAVDLPGSTADGLLVNLGANNDVTVTGSVTANAGTNLNTSALALESGGNLAAAATSLSVVDDWDESDRAKVNPIAGQAGVAAGAGAVSALTQRMTLASDDPAVAALQTLDNIVAGNEAQVDVITLPSGSVAATTAKTADFDSGAGTDTVAMFGVALPASGGAVAGGTSTNPIRIDPTGSTTQPVSGTVALGAGSASVGTLGANSGVDIGDVTINNASGASAVNIQDGGNSITVDGTVAVSGTVTVGSHAVTNAGTFAVQVDGNALTALQLIDDVVLVEDTAHGTGDKGVMPLAVRRDANTTLADTTGDYAPLQVDANGSLKVAIISGAGSGGTAHQDNAAFTPGTTNFTPIGGEVDDTGSTDATENSAAAVRMTTKRAIHVNLRDASGNELAVGGGTQYDEDTAHVSGDKLTMAGVVRADTAASLAGTDGDRTALIVDASGRLHVNVGNTVTVGSHAVTNAGTFVVQENGAALTALQAIDNLVLAEDAAHQTADPGVQMLAVRQSSPANLSGAVGDYEPLQVNGGRLWTSATVDAALPAGTNNIGDVDILSIAAGDNNIGNVDIVTMPNVTLAATTNTIEVVGDVAHDAAVGGNPVLIAARANANEPTAVSADGDATHLWADLFGRLVVVTGHPNPEAPVTVNATASGNTTVIAAPGASLSLYICRGSIHNSGSANITAILQDGASGTARWAAELASEGGGSLFDFGARGWKLTANTLLNVNLSGAGDVRVNITDYYIAA